MQQKGSLFRKGKKSRIAWAVTVSLLSLIRSSNSLCLGSSRSNVSPVAEKFIQQLIHVEIIEPIKADLLIHDITVVPIITFLAHHT